MRMFSEVSSKISMTDSISRNIIITAIIASIILLIPLLAMQFTDEIVWSVFDFTAAWTLLFCAGLAYTLISRKMKNKSYRIAVAVAVITSLVIMWANLAVGIIGTEDNSANWMFVGVLGVGAIGTIISRFKPFGMSLTLFATALTHALVILIALIAKLGDQNNGPIEILIPNLFFIALWIGSAWLFRNAHLSERRT